MEETKRILLAVLLKHHDLGLLALAIVEHGVQTIPPAMAHVWQTVFNATYSLVKIHQECQRSYKEVCLPVIERALFLFNELRPAMSHGERWVKAGRTLLMTLHHMIRPSDRG